MSFMTRKIRSLVRDGYLRIKNKIRREYFFSKKIVENDALRCIDYLGDKKGLFIDGGSNTGQGFMYFSKYFNPNNFDYVLIEPNPYCIDELKEIANLEKEKYQTNIEIIQKACDIDEDTVSFHGLTNNSKGKKSQGGSLLDKNMFFESEDKNKYSIDVKTFSFRNFLIQKSKTYDLIVIKMDIEGGEYKVLNNLLEDQTYEHINTIYVEFHAQYMDQPDRDIFIAQEKEIVNKLNKGSVNFRYWF